MFNLPFSAALLALTLQPALSFVLYPEAFLSPQPPPPPPSLTPSSSNDDDDETPLPLVIWHGLGDRFDADGLKEVAELADAINPGTYVHIVHLADSGSSDRSATFFGNVTEQVQLVCEQLLADPILSTAPAIDALGFSQGGQFLRGYIERCNNPPVRSLLTFGSQHNGISEFQSCASATDFVCQGANALLRSGTWSSFVQSRLVPAQYFRDPAELDSYLESSNFLADVNNERETKNATYRQNLARLENFVMYLFEDDKTMVPKESAWFAEVEEDEDEGGGGGGGKKRNVTGLRERRIYKEDWIGLKELDEKGALVFESVEGGHMQINETDLKRAFAKYYGPLGKKKKEGKSVPLEYEQVNFEL